jgi:hypothetical protein
LANFEINIGDVLGVKYEHIDHEKYMVVVGMTELGTFICAVFINSEIHKFIIHKRPHLIPLHVKITQNKNQFLKYDSFVGCDDYKKLSIQNLQDLHDVGKCRYIAKLDSDDFKNIKEAVVNSELLSAEELQYYFQIPID